MTEERLEEIRTKIKYPNALFSIPAKELLELLAYVEFLRNEGNQLRAERDGLQRDLMQKPISFEEREVDWAIEIKNLKEKLTACEKERDKFKKEAEWFSNKHDKDEIIRSRCCDLARELTASELARAKAVEALRVIGIAADTTRGALIKEGIAKQVRQALSAQPPNDVMSTLNAVECAISIVVTLHGTHTGAAIDQLNDAGQSLRRLMGREGV